MKKVLISFALVMFACAFASCNNTKEEAINEDTIVEVTEDTVVNSIDTVYVDTIF